MECKVGVLAPRTNDWIRCLSDSGCEITLYAEYPALRGALVSAGPDDPDALVLMADVASNCRAALLWRQAHPDRSLVAWHGQPVGPEQAALLSAGVDYVLRADDPPGLLLSVLRGLSYRRARFGADVQPPALAASRLIAPDPRIGAWRLMDEGWRLIHGDSAPLRLTVSERALVLCLFEAPGHVASHADLIAAVLQVWQPRQQARIQDPRCRSIVSRLRRRARDAGMAEPPIESLRDFGYAWAL
ncbi:MAG TPA: helix-turn-helix domain-containing protein [Castellaniella sp.]|jgi:DNA-binding response OmpR family regulator|nr:helix-turn-helix domain-containing protein [Castellaniella sp.]